MIDLAILSTICFAASSSFAVTSVITPVPFADTLRLTTVSSQYEMVAVSASINRKSVSDVTIAPVDDGSSGSSAGDVDGSRELGMDESAVNGCGFQFPELGLMGFVPVVGLQVIPGPDTIVTTLMGAGMIAFAGLLRRRLRRKNRT